MPGRSTTLAYGRAGACLLQQVGICGLCFIYIFFKILSILSSFSNASSVGRWMDILKYCGLGRSNPVVVVSYYQRRVHQVLVNG